MWKVLSLTSILICMMHVLSLSNRKLMIPSENIVNASNSDANFDEPNTLELDFSDFNIDTDEIAEAEGVVEFPCPNKAG
jgi:hypothetical protein